MSTLELADRQYDVLAAVRRLGETGCHQGRPV